jgi:hypothetical protein
MRGVYADDTQVLWGSWEWVAREAPVLFALFAEFGLRGAREAAWTD